MIVTGGFVSSSITTRTYDDDGVAGWSANHGDIVYGIAADSSGNVYTGGAVTSSLTTRKYNATGDLQWSVNHGVNVYCIAADESGNVYTGGAISGGYTTRKYDSSGGLLWSVNHGAIVLCITVDSSGNVYTGGYDSGGYTTRKYDSSGALQWGISHGSTVGAITVNADRVVAGAFDGSIKAYTLAGAADWTAGWGLRINGLFTNSSGKIWTAGNWSLFEKSNKRLSSAGATELTINLSSVITNSVAADASGNIYIGQNRASSVTTRKYDSSGSLQWTKDHGNAVLGIAWAPYVGAPPLATAIPGLPIRVSLGSVALTQSHTIPGLLLPLALGSVDLYQVSIIPGLPIPLALGVPASSNPPAPPEWVDIAVASIYRAALSAPGGSDLLAVPIASFQCVRRLGASTWLTVTLPGFTPALLSALHARIGGELVINAGTRNSAGIETLGLFLRVTLTAVEYERERGSAGITLTARVINPSYSSASRTLTGIRQRSKSAGRWTLICDADPLLRPNDTATAGAISFTVGSIRHSVGPRDALMEVVEDG